ncbi:MAG: thymidine phosphorylase [Limnochordia bacterium]|jgi:pyrimidine-nucleoside phosphorylase
MRAYDIILKKREGGQLAPEEIDYLIQGYTAGQIPDYQMAAWAMAVYFQGLSLRETVQLTMAMARSGTQLDLSSLPGPQIDKHSTGGVGDTTTIILAPLVAALGVPVAKMSGRGLGHTGGTIDKLEAIPGMRTDLTEAEFIQQVKRINIALMSPTSQLAPADKALYALRDATATVDSMPLIAASILSKKLAGGAQGIVFDVKWGSGAFMKTEASACELAQLLVDTCRQAGRQAQALVTAMDQPLGRAIGNALEVQEGIEVLAGQGPEDLRELVGHLGGEMVYLAGKAADPGAGRKAIKEALAKGIGLEKFAQWIEAQGGDPRVIERPELLPTGIYQEPVPARAAGYIQRIDSQEIGLTAMALGAGRQRKEDPIDYGAGIILHKKLGDPVGLGETLAVLYSNKPITPDHKGRLERAYTIGLEKPQPPPLISHRF